ncbi:Succinyl-CoA--L-malate CoA-transferase beta subunit [bacterium HR24]|nr:Succinyl-CoA--L-malate CoA-transferase beta subunit [bacterium HR24]
MGPLAGVRVVDLSTGMAGPYCTMLLADLGAEVIKVEPPSGGDITRQAGPFAPDDQLRAFGGYFQSVNRNKKGLALDLKREEGKEVLLRLVAISDVLVENFRAGVMERLGLAYERLREVNLRLVYAAIRGFGDPRTGESPYVHRPAFDVVAQAMGGLMGTTGPGPEMPLKASGGIGDTVPGMMAAVGVLAALHHARETGQGQFLDVAMYDGVLSICERVVYMYSYAGVVSRPQGNRHNIFCPFEVFPTSDGWVAICAPADHQWRDLCLAMGRPELAEDPRFATNADRVQRCEEVRRLVSEWTSARTKAEVVAAVADKVPCGPVQDAEEIMRDPHVHARQMVVELEHPGCREPKAIAGTPIKLTATPAAVRSRAPLLGEHTDEVLSLLGYSQGDIAALREAGVVYSHKWELEGAL